MSRAWRAIMNELTEALGILEYAVTRLDGCGDSNCSDHCGLDSKMRARAEELLPLLRAMPAIIARVRDEQMECLRSFARGQYQAARQHAVLAERELERFEAGFLTERLQVPGAPPATLRTIEFDGVLCWTLRSEFNGGELLGSGHLAEQPPEAPGTAIQVARDASYYKLRLLAQNAEPTTTILGDK